MKLKQLRHLSRNAGRAVRTIFVGFCMMLLLAGCKKSEANTSGKIKVVATTTMVGELVKRVGGDRVDVKVMMGPGVDPHTHNKTADDVANLERADLIFYNGLHLEGKMVDLFEKEHKNKAVALTSSIPSNRLLSWNQGDGGVHDPHIWFNAELWALASNAVRDKLASHDAAHADEYRKRADEVQKSLAVLHQEVGEKLKSVPKGKRVLVTSHDAYSYFGAAYDIEVFGLQGISTETEAGLREVNQAVAFIVERKIPAIFVESSVSPKTIEQVVNDATARGAKVKIGGELFSDAMGAPGEHPPYAVETYEGMMRYNVDTIVAALNEK